MDNSQENGCNFQSFLLRDCFVDRSLSNLADMPQATLKFSAIVTWAGVPAIAKRKAFLKKWRLRCRGVANSLEEAGERLFTFLRYPPSQWKPLRTTNAIERLHEEFKRRIKTQRVLPTAETAAVLFWALLACRSRRVRGDAI